MYAAGMQPGQGTYKYSSRRLLHGLLTTTSILCLSTSAVAFPSSAVTLFSFRSYKRVTPMSDPSLHIAARDNYSPIEPTHNQVRETRRPSLSPSPPLYLTSLSSLLCSM
jgi:hypothetical protein